MPSRDDAVRAFLEMDGPSIQFDLTRTPEQIAEAPQRTFSAELIQEVADNVHTWIGSRLYRLWQRKNRAAHRAKITITVELDDEQASVLELPVKMSVIDGELRLVRNNQ